MAAAIVMAAVTGCCGVVSAGVLEDARAQDWFWSNSAPSEDATPSDEEPAPGAERSGSSQRSDTVQDRVTHALFFSGIDLWRNAAFAHDGLLWTPAGAGNDGFVFKIIATDGYYTYRAGALGNAQVTGWMSGAAVMPGIHFTRQGVSVGVYAGLDVQVHQLSLFDPTNDLQGRHFGARVAIDLWAQPTAQTMVLASATLSTIGGGYAARIAAGWRVFDWFYLGPEVLAFGTPEYRQLRFGVHVTGLQTTLLDWRFEWQGGAGFAADDDGNHGAYARLGVLWRY